MEFYGFLLVNSSHALEIERQNFKACVDFWPIRTSGQIWHWPIEISFNRLGWYGRLWQEGFSRQRDALIQEKSWILIATCSRSQNFVIGVKKTGKKSTKLKGWKRLKNSVIISRVITRIPCFWVFLRVKNFELVL